MDGGAVSTEVLSTIFYLMFPPVLIIVTTAAAMEIEIHLEQYHRRWELQD